MPVDTSGVTDTDIVTSAVLYIWPTVADDNDNDEYAYISVVRQTSQASTLVAVDFDNCGTVSNPVEGHDAGERWDITNISTGAYDTFTLNATGIA